MAAGRLEVHLFGAAYDDIFDLALCTLGLRLSFDGRPLDQRACLEHRYLWSLLEFSPAGEVQLIVGF